MSLTSIVTLRRLAMFSISASTSAAAASRVASSAARMSSESSQRPGMTLIAPPGTTSPPTVPTRVGAAALYIEHDLGRGRGRVAPQGHRHRAGVTGHAGDGDTVADRPRDRRDDPDRQALLQQDRSLFDMHLEIA